MAEKSAEAERQQRYRDRKKSAASSLSTATVSTPILSTDASELSMLSESSELSDTSVAAEVAEAVVTAETAKTFEAHEARQMSGTSRNNTMIIIVGSKLRKMLPDDVFDKTSDPLARDHSTTWGSNAGGRIVIHEPADPDGNIWCAELTSSGRGKGKKYGVVLMSANCGFITISELVNQTEVNVDTASSNEVNFDTEVNLDTASERLQEGTRVSEYKEQLSTVFIDAVRNGLLNFTLPENRVNDYISQFTRVEFIKGKRSTPGIRLEEWIERERLWEPDDDPVEQYNIRSNWTTRKFGNSGSYRHVDAAVQRMLGMTIDESHKWMIDFLKPMMNER